MFQLFISSYAFAQFSIDKNKYHIYFRLENVRLYIEHFSLSSILYTLIMKQRKKKKLSLKAFRLILVAVAISVWAKNFPLKTDSLRPSFNIDIRHKGILIKLENMSFFKSGICYLSFYFIVFFIATPSPTEFTYIYRLVGWLGEWMCFYQPFTFIVQLIDE